MAPDLTADPLIGAVLDEKYRIDAPLGRGGMGTVYRAMHLGTGREVALKVLVAELTANEAAVERFKREARTAGQMRHPNVVDVTDFGFAELGGGLLAYLVMELLRGKTLRALMETEGRVPLDVTIDILDQVCAAVAEAHGMGVLHRDLKPENIHLGPGTRGRYRVKVLDFGIAKLLHETAQVAPPAATGMVPAIVSPGSAVTQPEMAFGNGATLPVGESGGSLTRLGAVIGTPRYMSPEQWLGREIDLRADVYSLGVVAYEMLAGEPPFLGKARSIAIEHAEFAAPPLAERAPTVPRWIASVVEQSLAKEPGARPPSVAAFAAGLKAGAETTRSLLRRSIELCADNYLPVCRRCLTVSAPPLVFAAISLATTLLARHGLVSAKADYFVLLGMTALIALVTALLWAPVSGAIVPLVAEILAPRGVSTQLARGEIRRLAWRTLPSTLGLMAAVVPIAAVTILPVVGLSRFVLNLSPRGQALVDAFVMEPMVCLFVAGVLAPLAVYPSVAAAEGIGGLGPLRRSITLVRPMRWAAFGVTLLYGLLAAVVPALFELIASWDISATEHLSGGSLHERVAVICIQLTNLVLMPFTVVPTAMLYLRAREVEGKPYP